MIRSGMRCSAACNARWRVVVAAVLSLGLQACVKNTEERSWSLRTASGAQCTIAVGMLAIEVHAGCGAPTRTGLQPKVAAKREGVSFCSAPGEVYGERTVLYDCEGRVATVVNRSDVFLPKPVEGRPGSG